MKSRWSCWSILLFLGSSQALHIDIPQDSINGTVNHSVLLPISYTLKEPFPFPLPITWYFSNYPNPLTTYTVTNCSVSAEGIPTRCSGNNYTRSEYQGRIVFFPENASLLLQNLQLIDSGVYNVTFKVPPQTRHITLTVSEPHLKHGNADDGTGNPHLVLLLGLFITGGLSFLLLLLLLCFCYRWHKGAVQKRRTIILKQQKETCPLNSTYNIYKPHTDSYDVPNLEESHMESSLPRTVSTIYARIGEDGGQRQRRAESQTEYASISFS